MNTPLAQEPQHSLAKIHAKVNLFFWISMAIIAYINVMKFPALNIHGEVIGEMGLMYYKEARYESLFFNLTSMVSAFIPLSERLMAMTVVNVLGMDDYYPWLVQWASVAMIATCCSLLNLSTFRRVVADDFSRFLIALMLGSTIYLDGMKMYNAPYIGSLYVLWVLYLNKESFPIWKLVAQFVPMVILLLGKAHYFAFAPFHALIVIWAFRHKKKKTMIFYGLILIVHVIQLMLTLSIKAEWDKSHANLGVVSLTDVIEYGFKYLFYDIAALAGPFFLSLQTGIIVVVVMGLMVYGFFRSVKETDRLPLWTAIVSLTVALMGIGLSIKGFPDYATPHKLLEHIQVYHYRHFLFSDTLIIVGVCVLIYVSFGKEWFRCIGMGFLMVFMLTKNTFPAHDPAETASKWEIYRELLEEDDYYIPTWTYNTWEVAHNSQTLGQCSLNEGADAVQLNQLTQLKLNPSNWIVRGFMLAQGAGYKGATNSLYAVALDAQGKVLAKAKSMTPPHYKFQYFRFDELVKPAFIVLNHANGAQIKFPASHLMFFGKLKDESQPI